MSAGTFADIAKAKNNWDNVPKCGAIGKRKGTPCQAPAMKNGRCRMHGGKSPSGKQHYNYNRRRYHPPAEGRLLELYEKAVTDPEILNLSQEMAIIQARIGQLLEKVVSGESGLLAEEQLKTFREAMAARRRRDGATYKEKLVHLEELFQRAVGQRHVWAEIYEAIDLLRKVQHREQRRRVEMHAMLTSEQAVSLMAEMVDIVKQNITDETVLANIRDGMRDILIRRPALHQSLPARNGPAPEVAEAIEAGIDDAIEGEVIDIEVA